MTFVLRKDPKNQQQQQQQQQQRRRASTSAWASLWRRARRLLSRAAAALQSRRRPRRDAPDVERRDAVAEAASSKKQPQQKKKWNWSSSAMTTLAESLWTDPTDPVHTRWLAVVSTAVLYNVLFVVGRAVFWEMNHLAPGFWLTMDCLCDVVYLIDMIIHAHEGYLEQGIMVYEPSRRRWNYISKCKWFYDVASMLPTDIAYFWWDRDTCQVMIPCPVIVRINRLLRLPRMAEWFDRTETGSGYPNVIRICKVIVSLSVLIHWNACLYFTISYALGFGSDNWVYNLNGARNSSLSHQYIYSFYWSTLTLTTIGETPQPENDVEYVFVVADFLAGVLIFATIVGNIGSMITNMNLTRVEFQTRMDNVKHYMTFRKVGKEIETRVIRWFDYIWSECGALDEEQVLSVLPDKLKAEIAINVHLETLQKVRIFQDCDPGLLEALVLKLKLRVFSPGDYICRKGDIGKEMYIVKRGKLCVVGDDGDHVLATLGAGSVFGEVSVLEIAGNRTGNRRTANVRSVGFSDLFCLSKSDLWETLADYPEARATLTERGCQLLRKDGLLDEDVFQRAIRASQDSRATPEQQIAHLHAALDDLCVRMARLSDEQIASRQRMLDTFDDMERRIIRDGRRRRRSSGPPTLALPAPPQPSAVVERPMLQYDSSE